MSLRLLWISPVCPYPATDGNRLRNYHLVREVGRDCAVTLICPMDGAEEDSGTRLREICEWVVTVPAAEQLPVRPFQRVLERAQSAARREPRCLLPRALPMLCQAASTHSESEEFDVVCGGLYVAPAVMAARAPCRILDDQNVEEELYRRLWQTEPIGKRKVARFLDWQSVSLFERRFLSRADAITVCSARDGERLRRTYDGLPPVHTVPNGVDLTSITFSRCGREADTLVMVGGMAYAPNVDGARFLVREIMPHVWTVRPQVRLMLVGKDPAPEVRALAGDRVEVTGTVPDVLPYLHRAALAIVPLRSGGGTRLKILEAMAAGTPVVTTELGAEGLNVRDGAEVLIRTSAAEMAAGILSLLNDPGRADRIAAAARARVEREYSWPSNAARLARVLEEVTITAGRSLA